jgi:hypothetical protein
MGCIYGKNVLGFEIAFGNVTALPTFARLPNGLRKHNLNLSPKYSVSLLL